MQHDGGDAPPGFQRLVFDARQCRRDLDDLDALLMANTLDERAHILPFFRAHPHLSLFLGQYNLGINTPDLLAYEMDLFGHFVSDVVVGDRARKRYCFVELEDAKLDSIFKLTSRRTTRWSDRFEGAFSQIVDWMWLMATNEGTDMFERIFGARSIEASALIVLGRDSGISAPDRLRWEWRRRHIRVYSQVVLCSTFDELARDLRDALNYGPHVPT